MNAQGKQVILIVDDERNIRTVLRSTLELHAYTVEEAADGAAALERIFKGGIDLVVLDLNMPVFDGMSVLRRLHDEDKQPKPPVIVLTAHGSIELAVKAVRLGALDFLTKPITPDDLRLSVAAVLEEASVGSKRIAGSGESELLQKIRDDLAHHDLEHAQQLLDIAAARAEEDPAYFNLLGVLHELEGDANAARTFYRKAAGQGYEPARSNLQRLHEIRFYGRAYRDVQLGDEAKLLSGLAGNVGTRHMELMRRAMEA